MKRYINSSFHKNKDWTKINWVQDSIIDYLNRGAEVYIQSGAANDQILSYSEVIYAWGKEVIFTTTGTIFPKELCLYDYDNVDSEEFQGCLFVDVEGKGSRL